MRMRWADVEACKYRDAYSWAQCFDSRDIRSICFSFSSALDVCHQVVTTRKGSDVMRLQGISVFMNHRGILSYV